MKHLKVFSILVFTFFSFAAIGQKGIEKQANKYFQNQKYQEAVDLYEKLERIDKDKELLFKRGVAYLNINRLDDAVRDFTEAKSAGYEENDIYLFAAKALHKKGEYKNAVTFYKNYLRYVDDKKEEYRIIEEIKRCKFGYNNQYNDQLAFVENLGTSVNTEFDEVHPVQSPTNQNKYYFSSNRSGSNGGLRNKAGYKDEIYGSYFSDMYAVEQSNGNWTAVSAFHPILNGPQNDVIQGFNPDGSVLYFLKTRDNKAGQIYADTFSIDKDPQAFPNLFVSPMIGELGDKDLFVFNSNTILFSSKREGGYGGYDLYVSQRNDGQWSNPKNLGPEINSPYDETAVFLAKSGIKLFFSSDRIDGFGGNDIYSVEYNAQSRTWNKAINVGVPINSPSNDDYFSLSSDGMTAVFSSDRVGSLGGMDIHQAYFKDQVVDQLMYTEEIAFLSSKSDLDTDTKNPVVKNNNTEPANVVENNLPIEKKEYYSKPLYYGNDEIIITPANRTKLEGVKDLMVVFPEIEVVLSGHSVQEGMREFDLYFSIKRAEKAAQYLVDNGIDAKRIKVRGLGSNFPHAKNTANRIAKKSNRRIDISFTKVPKNRLAITSEMPAVADAFLDGSSVQYYEKLEGLSYKIEVARTKQMYKADIIRQKDSGVVEKKFDMEEYIYTIGLFDSYRKAKVLKGELLRNGATSANVIPYMNDVLLSNDQIQVLKDVYPDLDEYSRFEK